MKKCLFCKKELTKDVGYITDGKIDVCLLCAGKFTLNELYLRIAEGNIEANINRVFSPAITVESGLTGQTDDDVPASENKEISHDIETMTQWAFFEKYSDNQDALNLWEEVQKSGLTGQTDGVDNGSANAPKYEDYAGDIENLSPEDFYSTYPDDLIALDFYNKAHKLGIYAGGNKSV